MRILLTGGSGDLGTLLMPELEKMGHQPLNIDIRPPRHSHGEYIEASITDRQALAQAMANVDMVVHIAAWHGIHAVRGDVDVHTFWDVNATGTHNVFEAAAQANVPSAIYISSTSVDEPYSVYGHTKVVGELIAETYHHRHNMQVLTLRPRAFIPHWNPYAYQNFVEWAEWFWKGAVHIDDVKQGVLLGIEALACQQVTDYLSLNLDGLYEYTEADLENWDDDGPGTTFRKYYDAYAALAQAFGLDITQRPTRVPIEETEQYLGYKPLYSLRNLLQELNTYGADGPPPPY